MNSLVEPAVSLAWSLWSELGVPGNERRHATIAVDPEPLIVHSATLWQHDARLRDEIYRWCAAHAHRISATRLDALLKSAGGDARGTFASLSATLARETAVRWPLAGEGVAWSRVPTPKSADIATLRPSLVRLRLRSLAGVGARADVLSELLGGPGGWTIASDLAYLGYSKRNVARVLAELADGDWVRARPERNAIAFQLHRLPAWGALVGPLPTSWPRWDSIFRLVEALMRLGELDTKPPDVKRVEAAKAGKVLSELAMQLGLDAPPTVRGVSNAHAQLVAWGGERVVELAQGGAPLLATGLAAEGLEESTV